MFAKKFFKICLDRTRPKGTVFTNITQWDIRKCVNHINSTPRAALNGNTPYELAIKKYGFKICHEGLQLRRIEPDDVILTPELLK